jgi:hypothetical protein
VVAVAGVVVAATGVVAAGVVGANVAEVARVVVPEVARVVPGVATVSGGSVSGAQATARMASISFVRFPPLSIWNSRLARVCVR